ncbi:hypothetical protein RLIN73S_05916 [Rhodanobacter lindaniclasticus]
MSSAPSSHRLNILTPEEVEDLYGLPQFSDDDRNLYFDLSPLERASVDARTPAVGVYLALDLGYFKAKRQFFTFEQDAVVDDLRYLLGQYFPGHAIESIKAPSRPTRGAIQQAVLDLFGYRVCDNAAKMELEQKARRIATLSTQPLYILRESLQYLNNERIVALQYTTMQDMVGRVVTHERSRVTRLLEQAMTPGIEQALDDLLRADEQMYRISALKREPKDFSYKELKREVEQREILPTTARVRPGLSCRSRLVKREQQILCVVGQVLHGLQAAAHAQGYDAPVPALLCLSSLPADQRQPHRGIHSSGRSVREAVQVRCRSGDAAGADRRQRTSAGSG